MHTTVHTVGIVLRSLTEAGRLVSLLDRVQRGRGMLGAAAEPRPGWWTVTGGDMGCLS